MASWLQNETTRKLGDSIQKPGIQETNFMASWLQNQITRGGRGMGLIGKED
jgi:hypothetical protein